MDRETLEEQQLLKIQLSKDIMDVLESYCDYLYETFDMPVYSIMLLVLSFRRVGSDISLLWL